MIDGPCPPATEPNTDGPQLSPNAAILEVEIASLIKKQFSGNSGDCSTERDAWDQTGTLQFAGARNQADRASITKTDVEADFKKRHHERPAWDDDMRIYDPEKLAEVAAFSTAQVRWRLIVSGALSLGLGVACFAAWNSDRFFGTVRSSAPIERKVNPTDSDRAMSTLALRPVDAPRQAVQHAPPPQIVGMTASRPAARSDPSPVVASLGNPKRSTRVQTSASTPSPAAVDNRSKIPVMPFPETKPTTIDGWVVRDVTNGKVVLQGPNGVWKVSQGDSVPGLGTIDSIVLWGSRWIISTRRGLITTQ
jgi:hypothetical protein